MRALSLRGGRRLVLPHMTGVARRDFLMGLAAVPCGGLLTGCALFQKSLPPLQATARKLPALAMPPQAIQLDVGYVERPAGDPLLGEKLWQHVDQLVAVESETRSLLRDSGFRVGVTASNPPAALQRMLGMKTDFAYEPEAEQAKRWAAHRCFILSGGQTDIPVSLVYPECSVDLLRDDELRPATLHNVTCSLKLSAKRLQEGWVGLEFLPLMHHGEELLRTVADGQDWRFQQGQQTEVFYRQRFQVKLTVGEIALITAEEKSQGKLGDLFFRGPSALQHRGEEAEREVEPPQVSSPVQRMLIVRLSGLQGEGPHAPA